ncbi:hypothetical protein LCGC14_2893200, partial [marine sediment metagenome]
QKEVQDPSVLSEEERRVIALDWFKDKSHDDLKGIPAWNAQVSRGYQKGRSDADAETRKEQEQHEAEQLEASQLRTMFEVNGTPIDDQQIGAMVRQYPSANVSAAHSRYLELKDGRGRGTAVASRIAADDIMKQFRDVLTKEPEYEEFDFDALEKELAGSEPDPILRAAKWLRRVNERGVGVTRDEMLKAAREAAKEEVLAAQNEAQAERNGSSTGPGVIPGGQKPTSGGLRVSDIPVGVGGKTTHQLKEDSDKMLDRFFGQ